MTVIFERRSSASAIWARRLALFSAVLLLTSTAGHRYGSVATVPFFWLLGIVAAMALVALVLAGIGFTQLWERGDRGGRASVHATLLALLVLLPFAIGVFRLFTLPRLTDISTDPVDPPGFFLARMSRTPEMNPIGVIAAEDAIEAQIAHYPSATGRRYALPAERAHEIIAAVLRNLGWSVTRDPHVALEGSDVTIEAVARSPVFGVVSDVAIRIIDEGDTSYVDMRSVSRYGMHDLGDNAAKIVRFFDELEAEILARSATLIRQVD